jgi:hypothetical protein
VHGASLSRKEAAVAKKTAVGGMDWGGDPSKWLALAAALAAVGVVPGKYRPYITGAGIALWLWRNFG